MTSASFQQLLKKGAHQCGFLLKRYPNKGDMSVVLKQIPLRLMNNVVWTILWSTGTIPDEDQFLLKIKVLSLYILIYTVTNSTIHAKDLRFYKI